MTGIWSTVLPLLKPKIALTGLVTGVHTAPIGTILPITIIHITVYHTGNMVFPFILAGAVPGEAGVIIPIMLITILTIGADTMTIGVITDIPFTIPTMADIGVDGTDTTTDLLLSIITML